MTTTSKASANGVGEMDKDAQELRISIQGKPASVSFNDELFWLTRSRQANNGERGPLHAYLCVPHPLILHSSFIPDADGGSLLLRLLAPPTNVERSTLPPFRPTKSRAAKVAELSRQLDDGNVRERTKRLAAYLSGPCSNLRLVKVEARISDAGLSDSASQWAERLMTLAYPDVKPYRKLRAIVNPHGGQGKAVSLFNSRVRPIFDAAGCTVDATITTHSFHGLQIAEELSLAEKYDAIVCVSGDGMLHEMLNGLAKRKDATDALSIPLVPIPAGSGNAVAVNLLGATQGFNLALAALNAIKGKPMTVDICAVTQPKDTTDATIAGRRRVMTKRRSMQAGLRRRDSAGRSSSLSQPGEDSEGDANNGAPSTGPSLPYDLGFSFLSQAIGLMADLDVGTEHLRMLGDSRFVIGFMEGVLTNKECEVDLYVKLGEKGSLNKADMRRRIQETSAVEEDVKKDTHSQGEREDPSLRNGSVIDALEGKALSELPVLVPVDPSWPNPSLSNTPGEPDRSRWYRVDAPISALYAGKIPYVARDLLQFPFALPNDRCVDLALMLHSSGRLAKLRGISVAETGEIVYDAGIAYIKCEAYRVVPRLPAGHKRLKKGGLVVIDGERKPYAPFQVEVDGRLQVRILSLYGQWQVPDVVPPAAKVAGA